MTELGRLERVDLGTIWADEAQNFTPWLAKEANLAILGETIGVELELEAQERNVGPFRADILCKDTADGSWVLIENQLRRTDHVHLGQLLTYAAGLHAVTIVWVAAQFTEEHRATLDWLNDITGDEFRFFGLEIELWRIGSSPPAPKFNVIAKPNDWTQSIGEAARQISSGTLSETPGAAAGLLGRASAAAAGPREQCAATEAACPSIGPISASGELVFAGRNYQQARAPHRRRALHLGAGGQSVIPSIAAQRAAIEQGIGAAAGLAGAAGPQGLQDCGEQGAVDPSDEADWPAQHSGSPTSWSCSIGVFRPRIKQLNAADWTPEPEPGDEESPEARMNETGPGLRRELSEAGLVEAPAIELFAALGWKTADLYHEWSGATSPKDGAPGGTWCSRTVSGRPCSGSIRSCPRRRS